MSKKSPKKSFPFFLIVLGVLFLLSFPYLSSFFHYASTILHYPYVWALTENENMLFLHGIISGESVYQLKNVSTFSYFVYPPFFYLLSAFIIKLFGFTIFIPRLISFVSYFVIIITLWFFYKEKKHTLLENSLVTVLLASSSVAITLYSKYFILARADMLACAFALLSIFFIWKIAYMGLQKNIYYFLAGGMALAALFTKQSVFFPYLLIAFLLFVVKDRQRWFVFGSLLAVATLFCFLVLNISTHGEFLKNMQIAQEVYGKYLNSQNHLYWLQSSFIDHNIGFLFGIAFLIYLCIYRIFSEKKQPYFSIFIVLAVYVNFLITGGNTGAAYNTMIPVLFCVLLAMKELYFLHNQKTLARFGKIIFLCIIILQLFIYKQYSFPYDTPSIADRQNQAALVKILQTSSTEWILGDRIDYAIFLAGKKSPLEASTHNVAREWSKTKPYAYAVEKNIDNRMKQHEFHFAVVTITKFGNDNLLSQITSEGKLIKTITISYMDATDLDHKIYQLK